MVPEHQPNHYRSLFEKDYLSSKMAAMKVILESRLDGQKTIIFVGSYSICHTFMTLIAVRFRSLDTLYQPFSRHRPYP